MSMKELFTKDIERYIEGVIKADDESTLAGEFEEYVLTTEAAERLEGFLEAYTGEESNGAWLSGYFGSGKSHLLKILAMVLENREIDGMGAVERFLPKCAGNPTLAALVRKAGAIPSKSILFNIDRSATVIGNGRPNSILEAFLRVYNATMGYSKEYHIAQMERELDGDGLLEAFRAAFEARAGIAWEEGRRRDRRFARAIDEAYREATGAEVEKVLDGYRARFRFSIEDFAEIVRDHIRKESAGRPGYRLNFFVDEVGQYVASHGDRMLNLQTIAEALNTECKRRSWLVVTSQTDLSEMVGRMTRTGGNDFSKIEARFATKVPLTGKNADEVIQRRLLEKTPEGHRAAAALYRRHEGDLKTMFDFADGSKRYRTYADEGEFTRCHPFVPYQFDLFRTTMIALSEQDAFSGQFTAVGERSMLTVCQDSLVQLCRERGRGPGSVVPFDFWFDGLRATLKPNQINQVHVAENNLPDKFAVRVLKALYLVKYVKEFKATARNVEVLLIDDLDGDLQELLERTKAALGELERQSYVQRTGNCYEYLTDEEKAIDREIRQQEVPESALEDIFAEEFFGTLLPTRQIVLGDGTSAEYTAVIDEHPRGMARGELRVHFVTPLHPNSGNPNELRRMCMGNDEMLVALDQDPQLIQDIMLCKQTERYLQMHPLQGEEDGSPRKNILAARSKANSELRARIKDALAAAVGKAEIYVAGDDAQVGREGEPRGRLATAFRELAERVYASRRLAEGYLTKTDRDVKGFLKREAQLPGIPNETEGETEVLNFIRSNTQSGVMTTAQAVVERFAKKPYGWPQGATLCLLARLWGKGKVQGRLHGEEADEAGMRDSLTNTRARPNLVVRLAEQVTPERLREAKAFAQGFFARPVGGSEAREVGEKIAYLFGEEAGKLEKIAAQKRDFPFAEAVEWLAERCRAASKRGWGWFFEEEFAGQREGLLEAKEKDAEPMEQLFGSGQQAIYASARAFHEEQKGNYAHWGELGCNPLAAEVAELESLLVDKTLHRDGKLRRMKELLEKLQTKSTEARAATLAVCRAKAEKVREAVRATTEFAEGGEEARREVEEDLAWYIAELERETSLPTMRYQADQMAKRIPQWLAQLAQSRTKKGGIPAGGRVKEGNQPQYASLESLFPAEPGPVLETEEDGEAWLAAFGKRLRDALVAGTKVYVRARE